MQIDHLDHLVLTVRDIERTCEFYSRKVSVLLGPVERTGATTSLRSLYVRDPDGNLLEISNAGEGSS